jgi:Tol biopolymer transport system component
MTPERWQKVEQLYHAALEREERERATYLRNACAGDSALLDEVESLLSHGRTTDGWLEGRALQEMAEEVFGERGGRSIVGMQLGCYQILSLIGAGGMGEVYQAHDTKLGRDIAIKVLPKAFADDPERLVRFQREARMLAALNHPNIATIYGLEHSDGEHYLVMELVSGVTLAQRISKGPVPLREALKVSCQIAEALEAAHEKGIVHRDLKPANVKLTPEDRVKVLDFGLAKAFSGDGDVDLSQAPTLSEEGRILGTPAYMSPQQARGQLVDKRTDIWAFGCVLFEMLSGSPTFKGGTISDTIAAILEREPAWNQLPVATPPTVRRLRRCLEKDPKRRLRDIGDARIELEEALTNPPQDNFQHKTAGMTRRQAITGLAGAALGAASTGIFAINRYRGATPRNLTRFALALPEGSVAEASFNKRVGISPDGTLVAYNITVAGQGPNLAEAKFYLRSLSELEPKILMAGGGVPFFSPDGHWLGFFTVGVGTYQLRKIGLHGGAPVSICAATAFAGATWADGDTIYFVSDIPGGVLSVPASGGQPKEVAKIDFTKGERIHKYPHALPGGKAVLFTVATVDSESFDDAHIAVFSTRTGQRKVLVDGGTNPLYSPSGHVVYARNGSLLAVRFDPDRLEVAGQPFTVLEGILMSRNTGVANFDISASGDLIYIPGKAEGGARTLFWVNRNGDAEKLPLPPRSYLHPRISPDARKLAIEIEGSNHDIYVYDFASGVLSNITTDGVSHWPIWSPDGKEIGYRSGPMAAWKLWQVAADRSHSPEQVPATGVSQSAESYSPDGRAIIYTVAAPDAAPKIAIVPLQGDRTPRTLDNTKYAQGSAKFSPDGRWVAYCSNESGKPQVYVQAFPGPGPKVQVSNDGGTDPVWKRTGGELFYRTGDSMMAVPVSTAPTFTAGRPQELWKGHYSQGMSSSCGPPGTTSSNYDVTADGKRFLMIKDDDQDSAISKQIIVVLNWADEVRRLSAKT